MKKIKIVLITGLVLLFSNISSGQTNSRNFGVIMQSYYIYKDKDIVEKTIDFINKTNMDLNSLKPILTGFFGALYLNDTIIKSSFNSGLNNVVKTDFKNLLISISITNIDSIYLSSKITPTFNDMNWASFFATGNKKYLNNIISNITYSDNRNDINLFLAGATAKWSLCSNSKQDLVVKNHLVSLQNENQIIKEILSKDEKLFYQEMVEILNVQKDKGIWN